MIIICPSCKKKFNIDINLIPEEGRDLQCGSCEHVWFYKKQEIIPEPLTIHEDIFINETAESDKINDNKSNDQVIKQSVEEDNDEKSELLAIKKNENKIAFNGHCIFLYKGLQLPDLSMLVKEVHSLIKKV